MESTAEAGNLSSESEKRSATDNSNVKFIKITRKRKKKNEDDDLVQLKEDYKAALNEIAELKEILLQIQDQEVETNEPMDEEEGLQATAVQPTIPVHREEEFNSTTPNKVITINEYKNKKSKEHYSCPVFLVYNVNAKSLSADLKTILRNVNFNFIKINKNVTKIKLGCANDHTKVKEYLKNKNVNFFTFTPKEMKPYTLIINKLPTCFDESEVVEAFKELNIKINILKVLKLKNSYLLQVGRDTDIDQLKNVRFLLHCRVEINDARRNRFLQCKNCQRFSHTAMNCNMPYRCVKCGESHGPGKCPIPPKDQNNKEFVITNPTTGATKIRIGIPVKCINCNTEGHTANSPTCPKRIELIKRLDNKREIINTRRSFVSTPRKMNLSYSQVIQDSKPNDTTTLNIDKECQNLFGKNLFQCIKTVDDFKTVYSKLNSPEEKTKALFNLFISLKLND